MSVSCDCGFGDYGWYYTAPIDFAPLNTSRNKRCFSCKEVIKIGDDCGTFGKTRRTETDIEERIHGDEIAMADFHMCETCTGLFWAMTEQGYCISLEKGERMSDLTKSLAGNDG